MSLISYILSKRYSPTKDVHLKIDVFFNVSLQIRDLSLKFEQNSRKL